MTIVVILIVGAITVLLITKGNNDAGDEQVGSSTDTNYETEQNNDIINEDTTLKGNLWVDGYKNWGEQKESFTLTLFDEKFTAPIELKSANSFAKKITYYPNGSGGQSTSNINEVLNSEIMIDYDTSVWLEYGELNEYGNYNDSIEVVLENFNETKTSIKDCFNNNWWSITELYNPQEALRIFVDDEEYNENWDTRPLLNKVVEVLGGPKHIFTYLKSDGEYKYITYGMYYEYSDFAIEISVMEIDTGNNYMCQINGITYAPKEYWEKSLEERKEDYNNFEIMK